MVTLSHDPIPALNRRLFIGGDLALTPLLAYAQNAAPAAPTLSRSQRVLAIEALNAADLEGLAPRRLDDQTPEQALIGELLRYAREVHTGRLSLGDFPAAWGVRPAPFDPGPSLMSALAVDHLKDWLDALPPPYAGYRSLKRGLAAYRKIAADGGWAPIPAGPALSLGSKDPRVSALRARLAVEDPKIEGGSGFDKGLQEAVVRAQRRFGLKPDGLVDTATLAALNQPVGQRVLQIIANMERWRWLPPTMPPTRVQVNSGAAIVTLFRDDKPVLSMKAVAGRVGDETPMLFSTIHSVVLNPPWNVPTSIANKELWPKERAKPGYLRSHGYKVIADGSGRRLQQAAGAQSALGRFKFDFENPYGVYLHDTPSQGGFSRFARQASHGCVRLEKPQALAGALLEGDPKWTPEAVAEVVSTDDTVRVRLPQSTPVFIFYWTAFAGADGAMHFRSDPYAWDRQLLQKIGVVGDKA